MKEIQDIVQSFDLASAAGKQTALATVVHVQGSSYRRPGARMLVTEDGQLTGAISGGCLEGDALRKAQLVMGRGQPMLVTYDTTDEDDAKLGVGLGCEGIIHIMIEPIAINDNNNPIQLLKTMLQKRQLAVLVTVFSMKDRKAIQPGTCLMQLEEGAIVLRVNGLEIEGSLVADAKAVLIQQQSIIKTYNCGEDHLNAFIEFLQPAVSMVVIGAGNDVMPLVEMARIMGWFITVVDGRASHARADRFPSANRVVNAKPENVLSQVTLDARTVFVLMTHNYNYDIKALRQLIHQPVPYIGILGPRKKLKRIIDELEAEGETAANGIMPSLYGPVGLDIGAETPEEIALSIIAEIKAVLSGKSGKSLRENSDTIHPRGEQVIS